LEIGSTPALSYNQVVKGYGEHTAETALLRPSRAIDLFPLRLTQAQILDRVVESLHGEVEYDCLPLLDSDGQILDQRPADCAVGYNDLFGPTHPYRRLKANRG